LRVVSEGRRGVDGDRDTTQDRVTIQEAARRLGVKEDAIRKRIQRGTLPHEKTEEGRVFVWLEAAKDTAQDAYQDTSSSSATDALVEELRDQVRFLREELARKDAIMLNMTEALEALEAPRSEAQTPEDASASTHSPGSRDATNAGGGLQTATGRPEERRSWWRRVFGP
jgi:excisionase family DNA binding protein